MYEYLNSNRDLWNEWTAINARSELYEMEAFKAGKTSLHQPDLDEVGSVQGKSLLHLQCHFGQDTLSWARLGAAVTGVDFSPEAIALARSLSAEINQPARFLCTNLYDLPQQLDEQFDVVYTSYGVLSWLPDLRRWAQIAARYVRPGGFFYIAEIHPFALLFSDQFDHPVLESSYFEEGVMAWPVQGSYADPGAATITKTSYEWAYPLGKVVSYLVEAGLQIEFLHEYDFIGYDMFPFLTRGADGLWRMPAGQPRLPLLFSLRARKV